MGNAIPTQTPSSRTQMDFEDVIMEEGTSGTKVHPVVSPPYKSSLQKFFTKVKETFFPDDPLRQFKGQPFHRKLILGAQYMFPLLEWAPCYSFKLFKSDLISGLTIASLAIPQGISYAKLANLPAILGLCEYVDFACSVAYDSSFIPPLVYVVLGSSMDLAVGPVSIASLVLGSMITEEVSPTAEPDLFLQLALTSTFFAGIFQAALGILRLGFIIDFLSKAILIGFMGGSAVIVALQQLKGLLGITHFTKKMALVPVLMVVANDIDGFLLLDITTGRKTYSGAPLVSVIISTVVAFLIKAPRHGISVIGKLPRGINPPSVDKLHFQGDHIGLVIKTGLITGILSLTEGIAVGRTFATIRNYKVDGNKEMMAIGLMNVVGSTTSCYVTTGSFSRSAINHNAGARTAMSNVVMSLTVLMTLLFLLPLFKYTPNVILGAIIIAAVIGLIDIPSAYLIWKIDKFDFVVMLTAFFGVIFISVQMGLAIAVALSVLRILLQITRPKTVMLGNIPRTNIYRNIHHYKEAIRVPGFLILSIEAPINFANITYLNERIFRWVEEEASTVENVCLQFLILDMSAVSNIDTSGVSLFKDLKATLTMKGVDIVLVNPLAEVIDKLQKSYDANDFIRADYLFLTVGEAVASLSSVMKRQRPTKDDQEIHTIVTEN
ncbi:unnamed protein product [Sphenostylis stenocarpa]|uniref:STAS domain-containing protein n=1 Tax=Sphenostylis stenocarpa TaxID=92480 RepID=A0AA86VIE6_9FABA|nr:unnamed protein product [Sphenostylis stenocarpa]